MPPAPTKKVPPHYIPMVQQDAVLAAVLDGRIFGGVGNRNNTLFQLACVFYENQMDVNVLVQGALNAGLHPDEVERTMTSVKNKMVN